MRAEFRQRLIDGAYSIRASGIYQLDKDAYLRSDGTPLQATGTSAAASKPRDSLR